MKHVTSNVFAIINASLLAISNSFHSIFTLWLAVEQIRTGWGHGTGIDILGIFPMFGQILCAPVILSALIFLILPSRRRAIRGLTVAVAVLLLALLLQYGLFWLFVHY